LIGLGWSSCVERDFVLPGIPQGPVRIRGALATQGVLVRISTSRARRRIWRINVDGRRHPTADRGGGHI